jgi:uncharacterized protein
LQICKHNWQQQTWCLSTSRAMFWEEQQALIVSDAHFGKSGHFRKEGISIPQQVFKNDMQQFVSIIQFFNPTKIIYTGDVFHSNANKEIDLFKKWVAPFKHIPQLLVKGNHDILSPTTYESLGMEVHHNFLVIENIVFIHGDKKTAIDITDMAVISGHIHPVITLEGKAKQRITLPCFCFGKTQAYLPAYTSFSGGMKIDKKWGNIFAITTDSIVKAY